MKKLISLILAGLMTLSLAANTAFASTSSLEITSVTRTPGTNVVTVSGVVNAKRGNVPLTLSVTKGTDFVYAKTAVTTAITESTTESTFTFDNFRFTEDMSEGEYTFSVYAKYLDISDEETFEYVSDEALFNVIDTLKDKKAAYDIASADAKETVLAETASHIGTNIDKTSLGGVYAGLSAAAKNLIAQKAISVAYDIPDSWTPELWDTATTETNLQKLTDALAAFSAACDSGLVFAELYDCYVQGDTAASKTAFDAWFAANKATYSLEADNGSTAALDEAAFMTGAFLTYYNAENFYKRLPSIAEKLNTAVFQQEIVDAVLLSRVEAITGGAALGTFINPYVSYIGINYGSADSAAKGIAHGAVAGKYYATIANFKDAVQNNIPVGGQQNNNNNNYYQGSTTTGNTGGVVTGVVNIGENKPVESNNAPFEDIENYEWAKEAIDFLYRRSIISGRDEKTFDPAGAVTRAEFIKMLVATYNFAAEDYQDYRFNDIAGGEWFAIYVKKAAAMGVITGDENGNFNPQAQITRQDMAVTIYRASEFAEATDVPVFGDAADISDYAKAAVATLHENGVVSGMGDMTFAPKKNVTRAEAAKILYNVLIKTIK